MPQQPYVQQLLPTGQLVVVEPHMPALQTEYEHNLPMIACGEAPAVTTPP